jgi:3-methyladenine DNA glycosylase/8-oxoguanine DNA glycosylase
MKPEICFNTIHNFILSKTKPYKFLYREIKKNGIIEIEDTKLDFFSFFSKTIISQQISFAVAEKIWSHIQNRFDNCYFEGKSNISKEMIKLIKELRISNNKKDTILRVHNSILQKKLNHQNFYSLSDNILRKKLIKIKGVGLWTADMMLIFYFKRLNVFPENDLIINRVKAKLECIENCKINFVNLYKPFLSILSIHFWKLSKRIL